MIREVLKLETLIPLFRHFVFCIHQHSNHSDFFGKLETAQKRISKKQGAYSLMVEFLIHGEPSKAGNREWIIGKL